MRIINTIHEIRATIRSLRSTVDRNTSFTVGFVPTMGYLHEGHESLLQTAKANNDFVVLSIFVNPLQFGPSEDFERYPRDTDRDLSIAERAGVDIVFMPSIEEMYPTYPLATIVKAGEAGNKLCGASRPGHFDGVTTVVAKLFNIVQPDRAYFGLKDAQQVAIIHQMVLDLDIPTEVIPCPIVREIDGLAKSSRNVYLSKEERAQSVIISKALNEASRLITQLPITADDLESRIKQHIKQSDLAEIDYVKVMAYPSLLPVNESVPINVLSETEVQQIAILVAVKFGRTRLIDNRIIPFMEVASHV
jgi:pantoate--beta-alanine ligase